LQNLSSKAWVTRAHDLTRPGLIGTGTAIAAPASFHALVRVIFAPLDVGETFFLETRLFALRGCSRPVTVSTNAVTALDAISFAAAMFILAASVNASGADVISLSFRLSIVTSLPASGGRHP
jgi:hypothetical protein